MPGTTISEYTSPFESVATLADKDVSLFKKKIRKKSRERESDGNNRLQFNIHQQ